MSITYRENTMSQENPNQEQEFLDFIDANGFRLLKPVIGDGSLEVDGRDVSWSCFGKDLAMINQRRLDVLPKRVWTCVEANGKLRVLSGFHLINRMFYLMTDKEYHGKTMIDLPLYTDFDSEQESMPVSTYKVDITRMIDFKHSDGRVSTLTKPVRVKVTYDEVNVLADAMDKYTEGYTNSVVKKIQHQIKAIQDAVWTQQPDRLKICLDTIDVIDDALEQYSATSCDLVPIEHSSIKSLSSKINKHREGFLF